MLSEELRSVAAFGATALELDNRAIGRHRKEAHRKRAARARELPFPTAVYRVARVVRVFRLRRLTSTRASAHHNEGEFSALADREPRFRPNRSKQMSHP